MVIKLNWILQKSSFIKIAFNLTLVLFFSFTCANLIAQDDIPIEESENEAPEESDSQINVLDTIIAKTNKIIIDNDTLPAYSISVGKVGATFPCGARFGISLQAPGYHIFSGESAYNATFIPNSNVIQWPVEGSNKTSIYKNTFKRVKDLKVGTVDGNFGRRWTISSEQFEANYTNLFDFELDGQLEKAGDYGNLFFEMLISIQELAKENEELKKELQQTTARLDVIEAQLGLSNPIQGRPNFSNELKISPNPSTNGMLNITYNIKPSIKNATLNIFDINGKPLYKVTIIERGVGNIAQSFDLVNGVYFYQLVADSNKSESKKLIIN